MGTPIRICSVEQQQGGLTPSRKGIRKCFKNSNAAGCILAPKSLLKCNFNALENNNLSGEFASFAAELIRRIIRLFRLTAWSPVFIQTQSLALRALRKRKPQQTQALALASSQSWLPLLRPSIPIGWRLRLLREIAFSLEMIHVNKAKQSIKLIKSSTIKYDVYACVYCIRRSNSFSCRWKKTNVCVLVRAWSHLRLSIWGIFDNFMGTSETGEPGPDVLLSYRECTGLQVSRVVLRGTTSPRGGTLVLKRCILVHS